MNDKELILKLNSLREIKLEPAWKQETRDVLLAQVSNSVEREVKVSWLEIWFADFKNSFSFLPNAAWGVICLVIILTGGSVSALAVKHSKPGDTLYVAKLWKEKAQLALTFNQEEKAKLDMKLASIHAMEITEVMADPNFNAAGNQKKADQLVQNFNDEINTVKERYSEISRMQNNTVLASTGPMANNTSSDLAIGNDDNKVGIGGIQKDAGGTVYSVEAGKDDKGMQFYDPKTGKNSGDGKVTSSLPGAIASTATGSSSGTNLVLGSATSTPAAGDNITVTLDKASQSFATKDFSGAKDILNQVGKIIDKIDSGEVKGVTESGTSTDGGSTTGTATSSGNK
jgi:hypothetical protein